MEKAFSLAGRILYCCMAIALLNFFPPTGTKLGEGTKCHHCCNKGMDCPGCTKNCWWINRERALALPVVLLQYFVLQQTNRHRPGRHTEDKPEKYCCGME